MSIDFSKDKNIVTSTAIQNKDDDELLKDSSYSGHLDIFRYFYEKGIRLKKQYDFLDG